MAVLARLSRMPSRNAANGFACECINRRRDQAPHGSQEICGAMDRDQRIKNIYNLSGRIYQDQIKGVGTWRIV